MNPQQIEVVTASEPTRRSRLPADQAAGASGAAPSSTAFGLSPRERDVVALLVEGRSNAEIGRTLVISSRTAAVHVSHILRKLQVSNRAAVVSVAIRHGLVPAG